MKQYERKNGGTQQMGTVRAHLHLDGAAILIASVIGYALAGGSWWLFLLLLLLPDLFMLGYLGGPKTGSIVYNAGHTLLWPLLLLTLSLVIGEIELALAGAGPSFGFLHGGLIWAAHIGMDRTVGYGYKYPTDFKDTDIGRASAE